MLADNVLGWEIVLKISYLPSKLRFSAKYSFFRQSLSRGRYQPTYQPPEGVYLLNTFQLYYSSSKTHIHTIVHSSCNILKISPTETNWPVIFFPESIVIKITVRRQPYLLPWHFITLAGTIIIWAVNTWKDNTYIDQLEQFSLECWKQFPFQLPWFYITMLSYMPENLWQFNLSTNQK